ncbi:MAG: PQQ-binding-like beta-propeller repeat protein [Verrucomicrobiales bacterium]|nr:PQQ-binding-like beta-propeller repeat protein [Verrucomicrobiales bacterium]
MKSITLSLFTVFLTLSLGQAQEWTRFRGPNGSGIGKTTGLPNEFTPADQEWRIKLDGVGHSSPVLWGENLYLTILAPDGKTRKLLCFDATSGKQKWEFAADVAEHHQHRFNTFASSTPTVDENGVYAVWGSGTRTIALGLNHKGDKLWEREWDGFTSDHGQAASPVLIQGVLVFHADSKDDYKSQVRALDPKTGDDIWELERITPSGDDKHFSAYSTPVEVMAGGRPTIAVVQTNDGWKGLDPKNGSVAWAYDGDYKFRSVGSIVENNGQLFASFGSGGDGKQSSALKPNETDKPDVLFSLEKGSGLGYVPTPLIHDGLLYLWGDGGILTVRDAKTGEEIYKERVIGNYFSSPIITGGKIYCGSKDGELICAALGRKFEILGRSKLSAGMNATPAVALGRIFIRTDTHLFSVKGK